jgi:hypothetical protein
MGNAVAPAVADEDAWVHGLDRGRVASAARAGSGSLKRQAVGGEGCGVEAGAEPILSDIGIQSGRGPPRCQLDAEAAPGSTTPQERFWIPINAYCSESLHASIGT